MVGLRVTLFSSQNAFNLASAWTMNPMQDEPAGQRAASPRDHVQLLCHRLSWPGGRKHRKRQEHHLVHPYHAGYMSHASLLDLAAQMHRHIEMNVEQQQSTYPRSMHALRLWLQRCPETSKGRPADLSAQILVALCIITDHTVHHTVQPETTSTSGVRNGRERYSKAKLLAPEVRHRDTALSGSF